ncbi:uncharacterized protein G2W53_026959 [Senna tora]|uniref:Uncharacterized protein n=1 Tax=Senna tora TaxID=362788 RepID=A0A834TPY6_9FABA|nr:uncharacterized protein G2W53_026959 [Senna tora]
MVAWYRDLWSGGWRSSQGFRVSCISYSAREFSDQKLVQGMKQRISERFALWLAKFDPDTVNLSVAHVQDESAVIDSLSSSFTELIMDIDNPFKSCNDCDEGPIWEDHLRENMSHQSFIDTELAKNEFPRDTTGDLLNCFVMGEQFWLLRDFGGRCGCLSLNYSFGRHSQRVKLLA